MSYSNRRNSMKVFVGVVNHVGRPPVAVAGLADTADVDEIFLAHLELDFVEGDAHHRTVPDVCPGRMGVAEKADARVLVTETRARVELVEHVAPLVRRIEGRMDNREIAHLPHEPQVR